MYYFFIIAKISLRPDELAFAGRIWPAGRSLEKWTISRTVVTCLKQPCVVLYASHVPDSSIRVTFSNVDYFCTQVGRSFERFYISWVKIDCTLAIYT